MGVHWSIKLGIAVFILMVFGWIFFPAHTLNEWEQFLSDIGVVLTVVALLWFWLARMQIIKDRAEAEDEALKDRVLDKIEKRKEEDLDSSAKFIDCEFINSPVSPAVHFTMPEMRDNAEASLSDDEKAMMRIVKLHPEYRRTGEYTPQMFGAKIDTKV